MKTTFGAYSPKPIFIMTPGETGLLTLLNYGRVPAEVEYFDPVTCWEQLIGNIRYLRSNATGHRTLVIDVLNGAETLCIKHIVGKKFKGDIAAYQSYGKGAEQTVPVWSELFAELDALRVQRNMGMILLAHAKIKRFNNPEGDDFDKYQPDITEKNWQPVMRWADAIIFSHHERLTVKDGMKVKATLMGRKLYTTDSAAFDAKNRMGLPPEIEVPEEPSQTWNAFVQAVREAKNHGAPRTEQRINSDPVTTQTPIQEIA